MRGWEQIKPGQKGANPRYSVDEGEREGGGANATTARPAVPATAAASFFLSDMRETATATETLRDELKRLFTMHIVAVTRRHAHHARVTWGHSHTIAIPCHVIRIFRRTRFAGN